jgi:hypothetical protein
MRPCSVRLTLLICLFGGAVPLPAQDQPSTPAVMPAQDGGIRQVLESIVIPPIAHAPFTATLVTEWSRPTPDGATVTFINERQVARDAQGRLYEERWALVPKNGEFKSKMQWIQIADARQQTLYNCSVAAHVCMLLRYNPARDLAAAATPALAGGPLSNGRGSVQVDNLGTQTISGMDTIGTRITTTFNPGAVGNDKPVVQVRETWRSEQLAVNLLSKISGPLIGTETFSITELNATPPDPALFAVPAGYTVRDERQTRPASN